MADVTAGPRIRDGVTELSAEAAAEAIPDDATVAVSGFGSVGYPKEVPLALARSGRELSLGIVSGGAVGEEIDDTLAATGAIARRYPFATLTEIKQRADDGRTAFADRHVSSMGDDVRLGRLPSPDVAVVEAVAVGEDWLVPSTSLGSTPAYVAAADRVIVEVNRSQPRELAAFHDVYLRATPPDREPLPLTEVDGRIGSPYVEFDADRLVGVVETDRRDSTYEFREPTAADRAIAEHLTGFLAAEMERNPALRDSIALEFGVGSVGNALMGALLEVDVGHRTVSYFGEVVQDGLLDAIDRGFLEAASGTSLALSEDGQRRLFDDIERYSEDVVLRPADVSNDAGLIDMFGVIGVNSAVEVDIYGHVNSTHLRASTLVGGLGGSGDFARNSMLSVFALPSTARDGSISRVVPMASHVDHTEHDVDVVVTDEGVADLRGRSPRERARVVVEECAAPEFRPALRSYFERAVERGGHAPHDLETCFSWEDHAGG